MTSILNLYTGTGSPPPAAQGSRLNPGNFYLEFSPASWEQTYDTWIDVY